MVIGTHTHTPARRVVATTELARIKFGAARIVGVRVPIAPHTLR